MRIGLTLGNDLAGDTLIEAAVEAERLGLWAVEISGPPGTEAVRAGRLCAKTSGLRIILRCQVADEHPFTIAEDIAVLDNLSGGRIGVITDGGTEQQREQLSEALAGRPVNGALLTPPPVQTRVETWSGVPTAASDIKPTAGQLAPGRASLSGDLEQDRATVDGWMAAGCTHLLVDWPGDRRLLARHLMTRAAMVDYPDIVSTMADELAPYDEADGR